MHDRIEIHGLRVMTVVGVLPHERELAQPLRFDLSLDVDLRDAGAATSSATPRTTARSPRPSPTSSGRARTCCWSGSPTASPRRRRVRPRRGRRRHRHQAAPADPRDRGDHRGHDPSHAERLRPPAPRSSHRAVTALGTNLGDRERYLRFAVAELGDVVAESQVFETDPVGGPDGQGAYLNMVVAVDTPLDPFALVRRCQRIEAEALRQRIVHWGPRTLDVDLLFYDDVTISSPELTIPHPRFAERRFVLAPLAEVAPERCPPSWDDHAAPRRGVHPRGPLSCDARAQWTRRVRSTARTLAG